MAIIHRTTMSPGKLELLASWLPAQPWYHGTGRAPDLARAGGFRLDDPQGEVGIEFMVVTDGPGSGAAAYQVPMTYRAHALPGADGNLIGTAEHGVLGPRWIYDGTEDPVLIAQLAALIQGEAEPQAQSVSHTPDPTVTVKPVTRAVRHRPPDPGHRAGRHPSRPAHGADPPGPAPGRHDGRGTAAPPVGSLAAARWPLGARRPGQRAIPAAPGGAGVSLSAGRRRPGNGRRGC